MTSPTVLYRLLRSAGLVAFLGMATVGRAADLQPFRMPWNDASAGITNLQGWQPAAAGSQGWVQVTPSGHYAVGGSPIRFLGVNVGAAAAMPSPARAEAHAARLARFGFNAVRFHHLEAPWDKANVLTDYATGSSRNLSAARLDRLHNFVAQLASRGIYTNVNLLVSREFQATDGLGAEVTQLGWKDQHILGFFNDAALALHQEHATKLLSAANPYRNGVPLGRDPAVAFVEIMNENGLLQKWFEGVLDQMPAVYRSQLQAKWNQWLAKRYASNAELLTGWGAVDQPLGASLLTNGTFATGTTGWNTEQHQPATASFTNTTDFNGSPALRINVTTAGTATWHVQLNQSPLNLTANGYYTISFWAKADRAVPLNANLARAYGDYGGIGTGVSTTLGTAWQQYTVALQNGVAEANARVNFGGFGDRTCSVWLADVRVQPGGKLGGLANGVTLAAGNIPSLRRDGSAGGLTLGQRLDWTRCLLSLEQDYWNAMYRHVKTTLGYPGIIWGTIIANSPPNTQAGLDAIDSHAYWQHPTWPAGQDWNPETWTMPNIAMVNDLAGGTLGGIARQRVKGKPHNVTEYEHPSPNSYTAEGPLLAAAYAALQDWDSLWMFAYETTEAEFVTGFFDHGTHPGRMANNLLAAAIFRRGDVKPALNEYTMAFSPEKEAEVATTKGGAWSVADGSHLGVPASLALASRVNLGIGTGAAGLTSPPVAPTGKTIASDTNELLWDNSRANKGVVTINTKRTKAVLGFTDNRSWDLGGVTITPGATKLDWSTIGLTLIDGDAFDATVSSRIMLVATGEMENTGQKWKDANRTSLGSNWGSAPTLVETVPATVTLPVAPSRVSAWALDAKGQRTTALTVTDAGGRARLSLGNNGTTVWYEVQIAATDSAFTTQPVGQNATVGNTATFTAVAGSAGTYQWQRQAVGATSWENLPEGGSYRGVTTGTLSVVATASGMSGDQFRVVLTTAAGAATSAAATLTVTGSSLLQYPVGITRDSAGNLYVADSASNVIRKISSTGAVSTLAGAIGTSGSADGTGEGSRFNQPGAIAMDAAGNLLVADTGNSTIRKITAAGAVTTLAGSPASRGSADGTGSNATFNTPGGIAVDASGNIFVADSLNATIRKITGTGTVSTLAGSAGLRGDRDGTGGAARFNNPNGLSFDSTGNLLVADTGNSTIRKVTPAGDVTTLAGLFGVSGATDGTGAGALFRQPWGLGSDASNNLFVADTGNSTVRKVTAAGVVTTIAGLPGIAGLTNGTGSSAFFNQPRGLTVDGTGNLYVADTGNAVIRKVAPDATVTTPVLTEATPPAPPAPTPTPPPASGGTAPPPSSSGGGGGGAVSLWFPAALLLLTLARYLAVRPNRFQ